MNEMLPTLIRLLADGHFHSGAELGEQLGISRSAVWKYVGELERFGLDVHSVRGKGYRLAHPFTPLDSSEIVRVMKSVKEYSLQRVELHQSIDSTNSHAMRLIQERALEPEAGKYSLFLAERQTGGKGRRGRQWASPYGKNVYMTLVRQVDAGQMSIEGVSLVAGLAVVRALESIGLDEAGVKWPNDILCGGKKLAGILMEITGDISGVCQLLIGIGLNVHCPAETMRMVDQPWTDLFQVTGSQLDRNRIAGLLSVHTMLALDEFESEGLKPFVKEWNKYDVMYGREVQLTSGERKHTGQAMGISEKGALLLKTGSEIEPMNGGELSLRMAGTT